MSLILSLESLTPDAVAVKVGAETLATFDPRPLAAPMTWGEAALPGAVATRGQALWEALGGAALAARLEWLAERALLQGVGYEEGRNWAEGYTLQPAVAQVLRDLATEEALTAPRAYYARWVAEMTSLAYSERTAVHPYHPKLGDLRDMITNTSGQGWSICFCFSRRYWLGDRSN